MDHEKAPLLNENPPIVLPVHLVPSSEERRVARRRKFWKHVAIFLTIFTVWKLGKMAFRGYHHHQHYHHGYSGLGEWDWADDGHEIDPEDGDGFPWPPEFTIDHCAEWPEPPGSPDHHRPTHPHGVNEGHPRSTVSTFKLPVSSDVLFLFARGPWSAGKVNIRQGDEQGDDVIVNVETKWYGPRALLDSVQVCKVRRDPVEQHGIGIVSTRKKIPPGRHHHHRVEFTLDVILPASKSKKEPLEIKDFRAYLPIFSYNIADLAKSVLFDFFELRGSVSTVFAESLAAESTSIISHVGSITGNFSTSSSLKLVSDNGNIRANISLFNDDEDDEWTEAELKTSNAAIGSNIYLYTTSSDTGGHFRVKSTTATGSTHIKVPTAPSDSTLDMNVHGSVGAIDVALHETYEGAFGVSTSGLSKASVIEPEEKGNRKVEYSQVSRGNIRGNVWVADDEEKGKERGSVELSNSLGNIIAYLTMPPKLPRSKLARNAATKRRPRAGNNTTSTVTKPRAQFLDLPRELQRLILNALPSWQDKLSLIIACHKLYDALRNDVIIAQIAYVSATGCFGLSEDVNSKRWVKNQAGEKVSENFSIPALKPIVFPGQTSIVNGQLKVAVRLPKLPSTAEYKRGQLIIERNEVWIHEPVKNGRIDYWLFWDTFCKGKSIKMTGQIARQHLDCNECHNTRSICPGCGGVSMRWEDHFTSCGWDMPCPACVGAGVAYEAKSIQHDEKALEELWKELELIM
ncbi:hypothetical protein VNI00_004704 [Paramarasmius palmivorus]|uniref:F-box domain-containing protein n=1 Tax=Paramarasmius palmivorus TaxID=297713 RepID=A0AAW0DEU9_9AGAR